MVVPSSAIGFLAGIRLSHGISGNPEGVQVYMVEPLSYCVKNTKGYSGINQAFIFSRYFDGTNINVSFL